MPPLERAVPLTRCTHGPLPSPTNSLEISDMARAWSRISLYRPSSLPKAALIPNGASERHFPYRRGQGHFMPRPHRQPGFDDHGISRLRPARIGILKGVARHHPSSGTQAHPAPSRSCGDLVAHDRIVGGGADKVDPVVSTICHEIRCSRTKKP